MKRILALFSVLVFSLTMFPTVFAALPEDITLNYDLTCGAKHSVTVPTGTEITVVYKLENTTNADNFTVSTIQNEIYYDHTFFEYMGDAYVEKVFCATGSDKTLSTGEHRVYINDMTTRDYANSQLIATFKLKVIAESGSSIISSKRTIAYGLENKKYGATSEDLTVIVGNEEVETHTLTYMSENKEYKTVPAAANEETTIIDPPPAPDGYKFGGWKAGNTTYKAGDKYLVTGDVTFTAVWEVNNPPQVKEYTLTFNTNGGSAISSITETSGTVIDLSTRKPTRSGYTFEGWYSDEALTTPITSVSLTKDTTVYAKWNKKSTNTGGSVSVTKYTLSFETNGGTEVNNVSKIRNTTVDLSKYITKKDGYSFDGWHTDKELTKKVTEVKMTSDITLYAKWVEGDNGYVDNPNYKPDIMTGEHYAYIIGSDSGMIYPQYNLTRAEAATIFFRLLNEEVRTEGMTKENSFTDVNEGDWFNTVVSTLANLEVLKGRTTDTFAPNEPITRAELTTIVARLSEANYDGEDLFTDISGHWAQDYINIAASIKWVNGDNGRFRPDDNITRVEVMTLVNRALNRQPETADDLIDGMIVWPDNSDVNAWYYIAVQEATNSHDYEMKADGVHEKWTKLTENPDWAEIER